MAFSPVTGTVVASIWKAEDASIRNAMTCKRSQWMFVRMKSGFSSEIPDTNGETSIFDAAPVGRAFANSRTSLVGIRVWGANEAIYSAAGHRDPNYRPDPSGREQLALLASATGGRAFDERDAAAAVAAVKAALGRGPTRTVGRTRSTRPLAPYVALVALLPLAFVYRRRVRR